MILASAVFLLAAASAEPTNVRPLEITPVFGRKEATLYDPKYPTKTPSILHVWASWCGPCRRELPYMIKFSHENPDVTMAAVAWVDEMPSVVRYLSVLGTAAVDHHVFLTFKEGDLASEDAKYWNVGVFPTTYFVAADGSIAKIAKGTINWKSKKTRKGIARFLKGEPFEIDQED